MPWCPKCRSEYREGYTICNDCKVELVDELKPDMPDIKEMINEVDSEEFFMTVDNDIQADIIEGILNSNKIPVLRKYREAGDYLKVVMGSSNYGIDIYVPSSLARMAKRIIDENFTVEGQDGENSDDRIKDIEIIQRDVSEDKSKIKAWMIFVLLLIPILIWMYISFNK